MPETRTTSTPPASPSTDTKNYSLTSTRTNSAEDELYGDDERESLGLGRLIPSWHDRAACAGVPDVVFFGTSEAGVRPALTVTEIANARRFCDTCPVFVHCLTHALVVRERYGVWAGTSGRARTKMWIEIDTGTATVEDIVSRTHKVSQRRAKRRKP